MRPASKHPSDHTPIKFTAEQRVIMAHWLRQLDQAFLAGNLEATGVASEKLRSFLGVGKRRQGNKNGGRWPSSRRLLKPSLVRELRKRHKAGQSVGSLVREYRIYSHGVIWGAVVGKTYQDVV